MRTLALLLALLPSMAMSETLTCSFTTICSPQTDCRSNDAGVPMRFDVSDDTISFARPSMYETGERLDHLRSPALGAIFRNTNHSTVLLSVSADGSAVLTEQSFLSSGGLRSVSYFGTDQDQ